MLGEIRLCLCVRNPKYCSVQFHLGRNLIYSLNSFYITFDSNCLCVAQWQNEIAACLILWFSQLSPAQSVKWLHVMKYTFWHKIHYILYSVHIVYSVVHRIMILYHFTGLVNRTAPLPNVGDKFFSHQDWVNIIHVCAGIWLCTNLGWKVTGGTPEVRTNKKFTLLTFDIWYLIYFVHDIWHFWIVHSTNGPMYQLTDGPMHQWTNAPMEQWTNGPMDEWTSGPMDQ